MPPGFSDTSNAANHAPMVIVIDLDGPILDCERRHYHCYKSILVSFGYTPLPQMQYWSMKRDRADRKQLLAASGAAAIADEFYTAWLLDIERPELLALDTVQPCAPERLHEWRAMGDRIFLTTLRQRPERVHQQLRERKLDHFFDKILVSPHREGSHGKALIVRRELVQYEPHFRVWIGDTEIDASAAGQLGCHCWLVSNGLRTRNYLETLGAYAVSDGIADIDISRMCTTT